MTDSALKSDDGAAAQPQSWSLFYGSPIVTIEVGQGERCRSFQVARDILTKNSPVMAAMLEGTIASWSRDIIISGMHHWYNTIPHFLRLRFNLSAQVEFRIICATGDFQEAHSRTCKLPQFDPDEYAAFLTALHVVTLHADCGLAGGELRLTFSKTNSMLEWVVAQVL